MGIFCVGRNIRFSATDRFRALIFSVFFASSVPFYTTYTQGNALYVRISQAHPRFLTGAITCS